MFNLKSPAYIACELERPVKEVWAVIRSLDLQPTAIINGTAHFATPAVSQIEEVFYDGGRESDD